MSSSSVAKSSTKSMPATAEEHQRPRRIWTDLMPVLNHGVRTPLNGILGMSKLLVQGQLPADERRHAEMIHSSAESLLQLIDELADLSSLQAGKLALVAEDFSLHELVRDCVERLRPRAKAKRLDLRFTIAEGVPESLRGDARRLQQVLVSLITNGILFTRRGFVFVTLTRENGPDPERGDSKAAVNDERPWVRVSVRDTGQGIAAELQSQIFEPFIQGDVATTGNYGGHGLGLALSRGFIDLMGGTIHVDSTLGQGSCFSFSIPCEPALAPEALRPTVDSSVVVAAQERQRDDCRVLIAEDDEVNRMLAIRVLEDAGYQAIAVHNGIKVLEALEQGSYDLILMDCQMPELDGYDATRLIRQLEKGQQRDSEYRHIPVIAVTALTMKGDRAKCVEAGMDDFIAKPYRAEELIANVDRHLGFSPRSPRRSSRVLDEKASSEVLDPEIFRQLRELTSPLQQGFLNTLVETFVSERSERCAELQQAFDRGEGKHLAKLSHKLISASGSVGAYRLAKMAGALEICARDNGMKNCQQALENLVAEYGRVEVALKDVLASTKR